MRALLVDDEPLARDRLRRLLEEVAGPCLIDEAGDALEAMAQVAAQRPDVVFLDIRMPGPSGIDLVRLVRDLPPIVFTTAYDAYALAAFDAQAIDYLLKPVRRERLQQALTRLRALARPADREKMVEALATARRPPPVQTRVVATHGGLTQIFDARDIARFWAKDKYTWFKVDSRELLTEESLDTLESRLRDLQFMRVHRSELVRLSAVRAVEREAGLVVVHLVDGQKAEVARRKVAELKEALGI